MLIAIREKGLHFVAALIDDRLVDGEEIMPRLGTDGNRHKAATERAHSLARVSQNRLTGPT